VLDHAFQFTGELVFIPGSMGAKSYILAGLGNRESLFSASHGVSRSLSRGDPKSYILAVQPSQLDDGTAFFQFPSSSSKVHGFVTILFPYSSIESFYFRILKGILIQDRLLKLCSFVHCEIHHIV